MTLNGSPDHFQFDAAARSPPDQPPERVAGWRGVSHRPPPISRISGSGARNWPPASMNALFRETIGSA
jgi:hypothetical protein